MITESGIKSAIRTAAASGKSRVELKDAGARGEGRLALILRVKGERVTPEWYAVWYVAESRKMAKMGVYPTMSLADARKSFRENYAPAISVGANPTGPRARRDRAGVTVLDLFTAYVANMKAGGKKSWVEAERVLINCDGSAAEWLGRGVRAADVTPADAIPYLAAIHARGAVVGAAAARAWLSAAFNFGLQSANAYTGASSGVKWGLKGNPIAAIPSDPAAFRVGERHLSQAEVRSFWLWLETRDDGYTRVPRLLRLCLATGQRIIEIRALKDTMWDAKQKMFDWGKTKNGRPHNIPVCTQAAEIMESLTPNEHGLYFPHISDPTMPLLQERVSELVREYIDTTEGAEPFVAKDIRRTWKTLAGAAGISKELRDRLQNHAKSDVSSKHYDRWEALPERRAAVAVWGEYLGRILSGDLDTPVAQLPGAASS